MKGPQEFPAHWVSSLVGSVGLIGLLGVMKLTVFKGYAGSVPGLDEWLYALAFAVPSATLLLVGFRSLVRLRRSQPAFTGSYLGILEATSSAIAVTDSTGSHFLYLNPRFCELLGYLREALFQIPAGAIVADPVTAPWRSARLETHAHVKSECRLKRNDGSTFLAEITVKKLDDGRLVGTVCDITEQKELENRVRDDSDLLNGVIRSLPGIFYLCDRDGRLLRWNPHLEAISGRPTEKIARAKLAGFVPDEERTLVGGKFLEALDRGRFSVEASFLTRDRKRVPFLFSGERIRLRGADCLVGVGIDLTEHKATQDRLQQLAHFDALTGLPNRLLFNDRLRQHLAYAARHERELAVLFVDLDFFKNINDMFGHEAGDSVLREAARRIAGCLRESDTVARIGGDEFLILLPDVAGAAEARVVAGKVLAAVAKPVNIEGFSVSVSSSVGIAIFPMHGDDGESLVKAADVAMYQAKRSGKNRFRIKDDPVLQRLAG